MRLIVGIVCSPLSFLLDPLSLPPTVSQRYFSRYRLFLSSPLSKSLSFSQNDLHSHFPIVWAEIASYTHHIRRKWIDFYYNTVFRFFGGFWGGRSLTVMVSDPHLLKKYIQEDESHVFLNRRSPPTRPKDQVGLLFSKVFNWFFLRQRMHLSNAASTPSLAIVFLSWPYHYGPLQQDDVWKKHRRIVSPAFNVLHLRKMVPEVISYVSLFCCIC